MSVESGVGAFAFERKSDFVDGILLDFTRTFLVEEQQSESSVQTKMCASNQRALHGDVTARDIFELNRPRA